MDRYLGTTRKKIQQNDYSQDSPAPACLISLVSISESTELSSSHPSEETGIPDAHMITTFAKKSSPRTATLCCLRFYLRSVSCFLLHHASTMEWEEQQEMQTEGKHWCGHGKVSLHDWLRSLQAPCSYPKDWLDEIPHTNLHGPGGVKAGSICRGEAYWHLCWVLSRSTGFRK